MDFHYVWLLNKPYENQVTLTGQNPTSKYYQPLEILAQFITGLDLFMLEIFGLLVKRIEKLLVFNVRGLTKQSATRSWP